MTTIYCPFKNCPHNNASCVGKDLRDEREGICTIKDLELHTAEYDYCKFPYCPEYEER